MLSHRANKIKKLLLFLVFLLLPFGYFARISIGDIFIGLYYWDILLSLYLGLFLYGYFSKFNSIKLKLPAYYTILLVFIIYAALVTINALRYLGSFGDLVISSLYLVRWSLYVLSGIALYFDLKSGEIDYRFIKNMIIAEGLIISVLGFIQLIFLPDFTVLDKALMWDPHQNRLTGLYFDPNFAGIILVLTLSVLMSDILDLVEGKVKSSKKALPLYIVAALVIFLAIVLTFSRSAWLAFAVSVFIIGLIKYKWIIPLAILAMFLVYYAVPRVQTRISGVTDPSDSFYFRYISWSETYEVAKENPFIGYGFNTYRFIRKEMGLIKFDEGEGDRSDSGSDSSILFIWVTTGLIGLTIFMVAHIKLFFQSLKLAKIDNFALMFTGFQIALLVDSQFINSLFFPALSVNLAIVTAMFLMKDDTSK
jgi:O-antigen ligase